MLERWGHTPSNCAAELGDEVILGRQYALWSGLANRQVFPSTNSQAPSGKMKHVYRKLGVRLPGA